MQHQQLSNGALTEQRITLCLAIKRIINVTPRICEALKDVQSEVLVVIRKVQPRAWFALSPLTTDRLSRTNGSIEYSRSLTASQTE